MGISIWQLLILLLIVVVLFGTKKLRNIGNDLGGAIKNFRQAMREAEDEPEKQPLSQVTQESKGEVIDGQVLRDKERQDKKTVG